MARLIHCKSCKEKMEASAIQYGECYEWIPGTAIQNMFCDGAHGELFEIKKGDYCFAAVLLTSQDHPNYERQKPEVWCEEFIDIAF